MRLPRDYQEAFAQSSTALEWFALMGLASAHSDTQRRHKEYAFTFERVISAGIKNERGERRPPKGNLDSLVKQLDRELFSQPTLPFPEEQIPRRPIEELIEAIEAAHPVLWTDDELGDVTIRMAIQSPDLMTKAIEILHKLAANTRRAADRANWLYVAILNLAERMGVPIEQDVDAFYASREWSAVRAAALVHFGEVCRNCGVCDGPFEVDHIVPVRETWCARLALTNLQVLCRPCHAEKHRGK